MTCQARQSDRPGLPLSAYPPIPVARLGFRYGTVLTGRQPKRTRNRSATEIRILDAARSILAESGAAGFGINAVARSAGVDKQLIYRYYGGLDGLLEALGRHLAVWWQDRMMQDAPDRTPESYAELMEGLALRLLRILRTEPLALQSTLWELTDTSGLARTVSQARGQALGAWMASVRGSLQPPPGIDAPAVNALIVASVSYLVLASRTSDNVIGLPTADPATWDRIERTLVRVVRDAYRSA
ncbi:MULTISPECIES: TetR/AcrR family transcriptional regulator [Hyphobacterium]|uniref:TetR/AcrR family transcriptional regulator n=1 Tax=Hyphobacterium vulgare TaxID=1736751 RepID=A0ABV7A081_9PROT